jgi:methylated-DNA-protein-cysteine methyltransferase-like protein
MVSRVPAGRVVTYGQVARMAGRPGAARHVGWALSALPAGSGTPWHRVVNASGAISSRGSGGSEERQRVLLEAEGVRFRPDGRIDLEAYRWDGRSHPGAGPGRPRPPRRA